MKKIFSFFNKKPMVYKPVLFLHIHKTAGTSVLEMMRQYYPDSFISGVDYLGHQPDDFTQTRFVSGHMGYDFAKSLMPGRFSFVFLRTPAERILSLYYYCKNRDPKESAICEICHQLSLPDFLSAGLDGHPMIALHIWNNQVWQLARGYSHRTEGLEADLKILFDTPKQELLDLAKDHLNKFSYVGFAETANSDMINILDLIGIKNKNMTSHYSNTTPHPTYSALSEKERAMIDELTTLDCKLYSYTQEIKSQNHWQRFTNGT